MLGRLSVQIGGQWFELNLGEAGTGGDGDTAITVDTESLFRRIVFSDGTDRWIPFAAQPPDTPIEPTAAIRLSSVKLTWPATARASTYKIIRDGIHIATTGSRTYRDTTISSGTTYLYRIQAVDTYGQPSSTGPPTAAYIDPTINTAPSTEITVWPTTVPSDGKAIVRVNSFDADVHNLAFQLNVDAGQLAPTDDPSVWTLSSA